MPAHSNGRRQGTQVLESRLPHVREALAQEIQDLDRLGHEYQAHASNRLRSGLADYEAWFEAGLELRRSANRLRAILQEIDLYSERA